MTIEIGKLEGVIALIPTPVVAYDKNEKTIEFGIYFLTRNISIKIQL
jgi:hypothetical protein